MTILLIGAEGQVGQELRRLLPIQDLLAIARPTLDLSQPDLLRELIAQVKPEVVINAAAYTAVDRAETEPELAHLINANAPQIMAEECDRFGARLIHLSTDYVFDGQQHRPYREDDPPHPVSVYGQTKLAGERAIQATDAQAIILRTAWVYGTFGKSNFVKTILRLGAEREQLRVVTDQVGSPTWAADIAQAIVTLLRPPSSVFPPPSSLPPSPNLYHYTNSGVTSWYDFAIAIFEEAQTLGWPHTIPQVIPIPSSDYPTPARRPHYSVLDCAKITEYLGAAPLQWRRSLRLMLREYLTAEPQPQQTQIEH